MRRAAFVSSIALALASAAACGIGNGGRATAGTDDAGASADGAATNEAAGDASADGQGDAGDPACKTVTCDGVCVPSCDGCEAGAAACPSTRACGHCNTCSGFELECFTCAGGTGPPSAFCSTLFDRCNVPLADHCNCDAGFPDTCPGKFQVCNPAQRCLSCGEDGSENGGCANGLICVFDPKPGCNGS